jgi:hypothetical protein
MIQGEHHWSGYITHGRNLKSGRGSRSTLIRGARERHPQTPSIRFQNSMKRKFGTRQVKASSRSPECLSEVSLVNGVPIRLAAYAFEIAGCQGNQNPRGQGKFLSKYWYSWHVWLPGHVGIMLSVVKFFQNFDTFDRHRFKSGFRHSKSTSNSHPL